MVTASNYIIKTIPSKQTFEVRHPVLRPGKPLESCIFNGDDLESTFHLGVFKNNNLLGVCSFFLNSNPIISESLQYQLRGMAVSKDHQKLGLGRILVAHGEQILKKKNVKAVWCNAREIAVDFYKKNGYEITGNPFNIKDIGLHYVMYKTL